SFFLLNHGVATASPRRLFGAAWTMRTDTSRPIHAAGPGKFTTTLPDVRPASSEPRRRDTESTSTGSTDPTDDWCLANCFSRCRACSAMIRLVFSLSGTSSAIRFVASVFGRGEYLNENR